MGILKKLDSKAQERIDRAIGTTPQPRDEVAAKRAEKQGRNR
jgi:hypothetical protein